MANSIKLLAKLTTQSKQIDGMGFGGVTNDKLEVAGALGMANPNTGKKICKKAYELARFIYVGDKMCGVTVKARINLLAQNLRGNIKEDTALKISKSALAEFIQPSTSLDKNGQRVPTSKSNAQMAEDFGIKKQSLTDNHIAVFNQCYAEISIWSQDAIAHINATMGDQAAA
tara:strand:- start:1284 stop:1799 length:516 start_codon:yes stop_codon:yes gene_type:complete